MEVGQLAIFSEPHKEMTWKEVLQGEKEADYFKGLMSFLEKERANGKIIYPKNSDIFNALTLTPFEKVRVVIIGQDPYHGPGQAHGLCFSVKKDVPPPPSLLNIFKELNQDLKIPKPSHGNLEKWSLQGVLLLNAVLSVEAGKPQSHGNMGWERFTDKVISALNQHKTNLVFLLWGSHAQKKGENIDTNKHLVLKAPHPSPLSANRGFLGCRHFSKTNEFLKSHGLDSIDWSI